jgi:hypothetical protein
MMLKRGGLLSRLYPSRFLSSLGRGREARLHGRRGRPAPTGNVLGVAGGFWGAECFVG